MYGLSIYSWQVEHDFDQFLVVISETSWLIMYHINFNRLK